jgi:hypothetical protein
MPAMPSRIARYCPLAEQQSRDESAPFSSHVCRVGSLARPYAERGRGTCASGNSTRQIRRRDWRIWLEPRGAGIA